MCVCARVSAYIKQARIFTGACILVAPVIGLIRGTEFGPVGQRRESLASAFVMFMVHGPCPSKAVTHLDQPALTEGL